ncbi:hypothetical protein ACX27O_24995 [Micromonospora sp. SD19]
MPENLLGVGASVLVVYAALRLLLFVIALVARIRWKVPATDLQRLLDASSPAPSRLPLSRRRATTGQQAEESESA